MTLMCNVSGTTPLMVSWMKPDSRRVGGYKLEVVNVNRNQAGEYKCEASNECGNVTKTANIIVLCKYGSVFILKSCLYFGSLDV